MVLRAALAVVVAAGALASPAWAQQAGVGVVTTVTGGASVARAATSQPLHFKDTVYELDRIATGEKSLVRMLLGGAAIVTVRELSELTLTESGGLMRLGLSGGRMGLAVARQLVAPGTTLQIHTPNAVASIRGSVVVTEVSGSQGPGAVTSFHVLSGPVDVAAGGLSVRVGSRQRVRVSGGALGGVEDLSDTDVSRLAADLKVAEPQHTDVASTFQEELTAREQTRALTYTPGTLEEQLSIGLDPPGNNDLLHAPITPDISGAPGSKTVGGGCSARPSASSGVVKAKCIKKVAPPVAEADRAPIDSTAADDAAKAAPHAGALPRVETPRSLLVAPASVKSAPKASAPAMDR